MLLSDDTLGIYKDDEKFMAIASYPFHRPYREAESLGYKVSKASNNPTPIKAIYLLEKVNADKNVILTELKGIEKYKAFHFSTFIEFNFLKQYRFQILSEMANIIPVYKVTLPWDINRLSTVHKVISEHRI